MKYYCLRCGLDFKQKNHFLGHLNRKNICAPILEPMSMEEVKKSYGFENIKDLAPKGSEWLQNGLKMAPNSSILLQNEVNDQNQSGSKMLHLAPKSEKCGSKRLHLAPKSKEPEICSENQCKYCLKIYSKNSNLNKHMKSCKKKKEFENNKDIKIKGLEEKVDKLVETMNTLLLEQKKYTETSNNTTNNTTNNNTTNNNNSNNTNNNNTNCNNDNSMNIHINNYGYENKDYITKDYLIKLLKAPFQAIPKLIEYTHFNKDHPENQNIKLPNKKQPYVKVLKDDKWIYADRKSTIMDLIDEKHCQLNDTPLLKHMEDKFSENQQDRFSRFNERYLSDEKELANQLYKETELVMINNS